MITAQRMLQNLGGVATLSELVAGGASADAVERAARSSSIVRVRRGIYATEDAPSDLIRAARVGGRLTGASATHAHGLWTPPEQRLVVGVGRVARLLDPDGMRPLDPSRRDVRVVWSRRPRPRRVGLASLEELIGDAVLTEPTSRAVAILDSMLRSTQLSEFDLHAACTSLPRWARAIVQRVDARAESGTESVVRVELEDAGVRAVPQARVVLTDLDRHDLLIGESLAVECDSKEHHDSAAQRDADNARDLELTALGFVVLRVRYRHAMFRPDAVVAAVQALMDAGAHLGRRLGATVVRLP